eukprot:6199850-Pleurochrysis_carterae.AAC.1
MHDFPRATTPSLIRPASRTYRPCARSLRTLAAHARDLSAFASFQRMLAFAPSRARTSFDNPPPRARSRLRPLSHLQVQRRL